MATDDERRRVAERLRELDYSDLQVYDMTYFAIQRAVGCEGDQCPDGRELCDLLADLIEPDTTSDTTKPGADTTRCDRDALLALAGEMIEAFRLGAFTGEGLDAKWCRELHDKYNRRIREALEAQDA